MSKSGKTFRFVALMAAALFSLSEAYFKLPITRRLFRRLFPVTIILDKPSADLHQKRMIMDQRPAKNLSLLNLGSSKNAGVRILMGCSMVLLFATGLEAKPIVWEYRVISVNTSPRALETTLNENGAQGWELVEISTKGIAIFKRQKAG